MKSIKQPSFREIRQAEKEAARMEDALAIESGVKPVDLQRQNSAFKQGANHGTFSPNLKTPIPT